MRARIEQLKSDYRSPQGFTGLKHALVIDGKVYLTGNKADLQPVADFHNRGSGTGARQ